MVELIIWNKTYEAMPGKKPRSMQLPSGDWVVDLDPETVMRLIDKAVNALFTPTPKKDALVNQMEAARILGVTVRALEAWRHRGGGPLYIRISKRCIRYRQGDLQNFITERERSSTSEAS